MALGDNAISALVDPGEKFSAAVTAAVTSGRFVKISGDWQASAPALNVSAPLTKSNLPQVALCGAGQQGIGVARWDAPTADDVIGVYCGTQVVPMVADGAVTAGDKIMSGATGGAKTWVFAASDANNVLGVAWSTAADTATVYVKLSV
jgi:hypothetical protein